ncbi:MAG: amino acid permease [Gemmatimonadota bacterium]|nr:amino acid permease [Gemmatimonadota bacterium]
MTAPTGLKRELSLFDATTINVGTMIASAIFIVPSMIALQLRASGLVLAVWILGGVVSLLGALCMAELGAAFPRAGGLFVYLREAYGPVWGFLYGWAVAVLVNPASIAAIGAIFAAYVSFFVPLGATAQKAVAVGSIVALTLLNCAGVRAGAVTQNVLTTLKVAALAGLVVAAFALPGGSGGQLAPWLPASFDGLWGPVGIAMVAVLFAYDGWIEITYVGGEVEHPGRVLPQSIVYSLVIVIAVYTLVNLAFLYVLAPAGMAGSALVASDAATVVLGSAGAAFVAAAIVIATLGANNGIVLTSARIPYAMARDGAFFAWAGRVHPSLGTPVPALLAQGAVASVMALTGTYEQLFTYVVFASWVFYAMGAAAVIRLRRTAPDLPRPYRAWGYPWTPLVFVGFAIWLVASTVLETPREALVGVVIVAAGLPLYRHWSRERQST